MLLRLHKLINFYKTNDKFYFQPIECPTEALIIHRITGEINLSKQFTSNSLPINTTSSLIYGIIGIKQLISCPYLIVITQASQVATITKQPIYKIDKIDVIPFSEKLELYNEDQYDWNNDYISMLYSLFKTPYFYFSYSYDLTNCQQRIFAAAKAFNNKNDEIIHSSFNQQQKQVQYDLRFLWNHDIMQDFNTCNDDCHRYCLPIILGFVRSNRVFINNNSLSWILISRRGTARAGTRFNRRGLDEAGNAANFVETEQIVEFDNMITSFVQLRGSIPLVWTQKANHKYRPPVIIDEFANQELTMKKHFDSLLAIYDNVSVVNLIDDKGFEGMLERMFRSILSKLQKNLPISYHYFDFHKECSRMRWYRLSILLDDLKQEIDAQRYFVRTLQNEILQMQTGVFRVNCIDSLDRTNVVQSMIALQVLEHQLRQQQILPRELNLSESRSDFLFQFKNTWADNADNLSIQYAGTRALKTDFTRTGKRTRLGLVKDATNSLTRYFQNNFFDDYRQDAIDLLLCNFDGYPSPLYRHSSLSLTKNTIPVSFVVITLLLMYFYLRY